MTEELKKALENAKTEDEKKAVAEKFKLTIRKLTDEELDQVAGGNIEICDPGCLPINNGCYCPDDNEFW